jgi:hypothetical protein
LVIWQKFPRFPGIFVQFLNKWYRAAILVRDKKGEGRRVKSEE